MKGSRPLQRTIEVLEGRGYSVAIVEKFVRGGKIAFRKDVWGFGDLLVCRAPFIEVCTLCRGNGMIVPRPSFVSKCKNCNGSGKVRWAAITALVQCCSSDAAKHRKKMLEQKELPIWKAAGNRVFLASWVRRGKKRERFWKLNLEEI